MGGERYHICTQRIDIVEIGGYGKSRLTMDGSALQIVDVVWSNLALGSRHLPHEAGRDWMGVKDSNGVW